MNTAEFHQNVEQVWQQIEEQLDEQQISVDYETQGAVFTLYFDDDSQIVINKQESMQEIWVASRLGGFHFKWQDEQWQNADGLTFWAHLRDAFARHGEDVSF